MINRDFITDARFVLRIGPFLSMAVFTGLMYLFLTVVSADSTLIAGEARCTVVGSEPSGDRVFVNVNCDVNNMMSTYSVSAPADVIVLLSSTSKNARCNIYELGRARNCQPTD